MPVSKLPVIQKTIMNPMMLKVILKFCTTTQLFEISLQQHLLRGRGKIKFFGGYAQKILCGYKSENEKKLKAEKFHLYMWKK